MFIQHSLRAVVDAPYAFNVAKSLLAAQTRSFAWQSPDLYPANKDNIIRPLTPRELSYLQQSHDEKALRHQYKLLKMHGAPSFEDQYKNLFDKLADDSESTSPSSTAATVVERPRPSFVPALETSKFSFMPYKSKDPAVPLSFFEEPEVLSNNLLESLAESAAAAATMSQSAYTHSATKDNFQYASLGKCSIPFLTTNAKKQNGKEQKAAGASRLSCLNADEDWKLSFDQPEHVSEPIKMIPASERQQQPLTNEQNEKLWVRAEELARLNALPEIILGKFGLTARLVEAAREALRGKRLVRVRLGSTAPATTSSRFIAFALEGALDCNIVRIRQNSVTIFK
uniref:CRM domain-containing protein n=1 Tax=Polytomella parva TaxID=51329 RepID=A0A7S0V9B6_9CHLO|mmetsp:Transcript_33350/g.60266  ORF Transcript_33350/g.60266 Transcript_33350/m.60266 type:complete len:341 (+) Transcript_33350:91-1113(+)